LFAGEVLAVEELAEMPVGGVEEAHLSLEESPNYT
jgi:hypothetical protein